MANTRTSEPRGQHTVPSCYLAGFTEGGTRENRLWVTDLKRKHQWPTSPPNAGRRRDYYKLSQPGVDPLSVEDAFSKMENVWAPLLRDLFENPRDPNANELGDLAYLAGVLFIRAPAFRPILRRLTDDIHRDWLTSALANSETWKRELKKMGISDATPGTSYKGMLDYKRDVLDTGRYTLNAATDWYMQKGLQALERSIVPALAARFWGIEISPSGSFITSDNPVTMDGPKHKMLGFKSAEVVVMPINRKTYCYATERLVRGPLVSRRLIAHNNTLTMLNADEQVYSHIPDFCWLDENQEYQTDWKLFDKGKILDSIS